ncbi:MAG: phage holin family protein [Verrucomicrobia bacterium]|nr:phage holin family protein [Verrucomicrobiota bacterium]MBU4428616.1 phage holin family protein [Verrucomicrobiota bacterium]
MFAAIIRWFILTLAVWVSAHVIPGIQYDIWQNLLIAALVLGILNVFVKPILMLISMPFIVVTLGFFLILINALLLKLTARLVPGFHVASFWSALGGGLVISIVSFFFGRPRPYFRARRFPTDFGPHGPPPGKGPIIDV